MEYRCINAWKREYIDFTCCYGITDIYISMLGNLRTLYLTGCEYLTKTEKKYYSCKIEYFLLYKKATIKY